MKEIILMKKFVVCTNQDSHNLFFMENLVFDEDYYSHARDFIETAADIWNTWQVYVDCKVMSEAQVNTLEHVVIF